MSQFYDQASLVMVPSGYKAGKVYSQKPLSTDGELTFTRNSNATRIGPDGKLEKVRTNELLYSNDFSNAAWVKASVTVTSGQTDKDGGNTAWLVDISGGTSDQRIYQSFTASGLHTAHLVVKKGTVDWVSARISSDCNIWFDLTNGVTGGSTLTTGLIDAKITDAGGGFYKCSITFNLSGAKELRWYPADGDFDVTHTSGSIYIQNAQLETGDIATDWIETASAAVSVGATANTPRLNYSNGCPSLLLEPQRTNLALQSEAFDSASWTKSRTTITANAAISPDGYQNADKITITTSGGNNEVYQYIVGITNGYTLSLYAKKDTARWLAFGTNVTTDKLVWFDLENGEVGTTATNYIASIQSVGGGWYRCAITVGTGAAVSPYLDITLTNSDGVLGGALNLSAFVWGAQLEANASYASSYIGPTLGASVTRLADAAYKTGISSLIGQTEGTIFFEVNDFSYNPQSVLFKITGLISAQSRSSNQIRFEGSGYDYFYTPTQQHLKVAAAYTASTIVIYINGAQVHEDTSVTISGGSNLLFNESGSGTEILNQALLFKTRLTNADLETLTAL